MLSKASRGKFKDRLEKYGGKESITRFPERYLVKNLPAMQETPVQVLGQDETPEKEIATQASILAWEIPWTEESGGLQFIGSQELDTT